MGEEHIGPYRIVTKLGQGGMGEVFEAIHEVIERRVAIKLLPPDRAREPEAAARFFNEARAVNRIEHPGLVQVSDYGQTPAGSLYIVMELLRGETLSQRLRQRGRLSLDETLAVCRQVASALVAAHAKGIIHRDLKPANLMFVPDPELPGGERVKVLDFGIAKLTSVTDPGQFHTNSDVLLGTPRYMSPEQCRGNREVDERSDVYSLGVVLYLLLAGRPPFESQGSGELIAMHIYEPVPPLAPLAPLAPPALVALCHRMLAKEKSERPSMRGVLDALDALGAAPRSRSTLDPSPARLVAAEPLTTDAVASPDLPPTLSAVSGQSLSRPSSALAPRLVAGFAGGLLLALLGRTLWTSPAASSPAASSPTAVGPASAVSEPTSVVRWSVQSRPAGAEVVRSDDGVVLGRTPWTSEQPAANGTSELRLRLAGFVERRVRLDRDHDAQREELLDPLPAAAPRASTITPRPARSAARPRPERIDVED